MSEIIKRPGTRLVFSGTAEQVNRKMAQTKRRQKAKGGWFNWYVNRGRLPLKPTRKELRAISNRRVF